VSSRRLYIDSHTDDVFGSFGHIGPSPAESALVIEFTRALLACGCRKTSKYPGTSWVSPPGPAAQTELRRNRACPFPSAGTCCVYYRQPTAAAGFSTESLRASRQRGRPPASAVPPPRPERKEGARAIHAGRRDPLHRRPIAPALRSHADTGHRTCPCATCTPPCTMLSIMPT
jgi:hypothetical protein